MENKDLIAKHAEKYMRLALTEAAKGAAGREIPVGCVIVGTNGEILARAHNEVEKRKNSLLHAEIVAIGKAMRKTGEKYLMGASIFITLEPCAMCAGAISHAKIGRLFFGARDEKAGAVESGARLYEKGKTLFKPEIRGGIMARECSARLTDFFKAVRKNALKTPKNIV